MYTPLAGARQIESVLTAVPGVPGVIIVRVATVSGTLLWARSHVVNTNAAWSTNPSVATGSAIFTMRPVLVESLAGLVRRSKVRMTPRPPEVPNAHPVHAVQF